MQKYYTRACNFFYGKNSQSAIKHFKAIPLSGNKNISFNHIEIISRKNSKVISIDKIKELPKKIMNKVLLDLENIKKEKFFKGLSLSKQPILMGILNLTPDSFSDGGKYNNLHKSKKQINHLIKSGCKIIDVGGESTRPGSKAVSNTTEWKRIHDVLKILSKCKIFTSLDTRKKKIMEKSQKYSINLINDISGLNHDQETLKFLKKTNIPFVINHIKGNPENMQNKPPYKNVLLDIYDYFEKKIKLIRSIGINHENIILDPGIGFGKNLKHNITLINKISLYHSLGYPLLLGTSRKRFIKDISKNNDTKNRTGGSMASNIFLMTQGVQILRVHDVNEVNQAIKVFNKIS